MPSIFLNFNMGFTLIGSMFPGEPRGEEYKETSIRLSKKKSSQHHQESSSRTMHHFNTSFSITEKQSFNTNLSKLISLGA